MDGKLIIFSAPSGAGKTSIVNYLLNLSLPLEFSISATSRKPRKGETMGIDYHFLSVDEFKTRIDKDLFTEWEEVYEDHFYGTLKSEIRRVWDKGKHVIFDVDVIGGLKLKSIFGENALSFFVMPPNIQTLEKRLSRRGTDSPVQIEMRLTKAAREMTSAKQFDHIIINEYLVEACKEAENLVRDFLH